MLLSVKEQQLQLSLWQYHDLRYFVVIPSVLMDLLTSSTTIKWIHEGKLLNTQFHKLMPHLMMIQYVFRERHSKWQEWLQGLNCISILYVIWPIVPNLWPTVFLPQKLNITVGGTRRPLIPIYEEYFRRNWNKMVCQFKWFIVFPRFSAGQTLNVATSLITSIYQL